MGTLNEFLVEKRVAYRAIRDALIESSGGSAPLGAHGRVAGRSGIREIRIGEFQVITDTPTYYAGQDLGPSAPDLLLGALASCVLHTALIQAADQEVSLDAVSVDVSAQFHPLGQTPGFEHVPVEPYDISYTLHIDSAESSERLERLHEDIRARCGLINLLQNPQTISGTVDHTRADVPAEP